MFTRYKLDECGMDVGFTQMYDYAKLSFSIGSPYDSHFEVSLSENDIDLLIEKLAEMKKELNDALKQEGVKNGK